MATTYSHKKVNDIEKLNLDISDFFMKGIYYFFKKTLIL